MTYWTGIWRPGQEAISNEVATLRRALAPRAPVVSFSQGQRSWLWPSDRTIRLSGQRTWLLRALAATVERTGDVTHAWGAVDDWFFPSMLGRRPVVYTVALPGAPFAVEHYARISLFVAESDALVAELGAAGIPADRIRLVYPGVDLAVFHPAPAPATRFRLLFASSPSDVDEFRARGIHLLVEIARACPDIDVVLLWREWGDEAAAARAFRALDAPPNLVRESRGARTMAEIYRSAHAVACLYADGFGKSCPNSVVEGLACGRPALVSEHCGIANLVADSEAGFSTPLAAAAAVDALRRLHANWTHHSTCARALAERELDVDGFVARYREIYSNLATFVS